MGYEVWNLNNKVYFVCSECRATLRTEAGIKTHMKNCHGWNIDPDIDVVKN